jgi:hypothetical protein
MHNETRENELTKEILIPEVKRSKEINFPQPEASELGAGRARSVGLDEGDWQAKPCHTR